VSSLSKNSLKFKKKEKLVSLLIYSDYLMIGGSGGGGKPFIAFGGSSKSSQVVCRNDPENPGQQICKRVERYSYIDPRTG
jgi:hypothetical protein